MEQAFLPSFASFSSAGRFFVSFFRAAERSMWSFQRRSEFVKGGVKLDHWGGGKLDQMSVWEMGIGREGGV